MRLAIAKPAEEDLVKLVGDIAADNPRRGAAVPTHRGTAQLAEFPDIGRVRRVPDTREFTVTGSPYLTVNHVNGETLTIVAVLHTSRDLAHVLAGRGTQRVRRDGLLPGE